MTQGVVRLDLAQYRALEARLASLIPPVRFSAAVNLKLERITRLLALLGDPHTAYPTIHVGGTSGKGSTATMTAAILTAAGYRTGLHTSPHLQLLNERHQIDGQIAPTADLAALLDEMWPALEQVAQELPFGRPSYFEVQFALAALWFARQQVDVAVIEVGLGGTLDATNVIPARVAVLTSVGLDHTEILGDTIEQIISDKAGIIKPGQIVVTGVTQPSARAIIAERCAAQGATLWAIGEAFEGVRRGESADIRLHSRIFPAITPALAGEFQFANAACAIAAAVAFAGDGLPLEPVRHAIATARLPGRMETLQHHPLVILDGAHNPDKIGAAAAALPAHGRVILVLGLKAGKDLPAILHQVLPLASHFVATEFGVKGLWLPNTAQEIAQAAAIVRPDLPVTVLPDAQEAVAHALALAGPDDLVWITGSLYLAGDVRERWFPLAQLLR
jgi:dihydrofolate synthase/folylpolyglutamate synthase